MKGAPTGWLPVGAATASEAEPRIDRRPTGIAGRLAD